MIQQNLGQNQNKKAAPFNKDGAKKVEEAVDESLNKLMNEMDGSQAHQRNSSLKKITRRKYGVVRHGSKREDNKYHSLIIDDKSATNESVKKIYSKANAILKENQEIKKVLTKVKGLFTEAAITNVHLGNIIKLITENSTTADEKKNIISRFANEATSIKSSNKLYESISRELQNKKPINEAKIGTQVSATGSKQINETKLYESKDMNNIKDLMNRMEKLI